jgi:hypothetical protein
VPDGPQQRLSERIKVPAPAHENSPNIGLLDANGEATFDDVRIKTVKPE